ncbi:hypothetical protein FA15DRAFT_670119 [Coprinopsis marcescibilis]|uniref:Uncharacterized protein n=1 Tax=Coprinopsis marcescibilis TaxID=230819 RepID=A0A5C3KU59_COPMA|nr:hypothetical protein FA15DRAFT_670119 [Coprinopsis marcescibilis]
MDGNQYDQARLILEFEEERQKLLRERCEMEDRLNQVLLKKDGLEKKVLTQKRMIRWLEGERQKAKKDSKLLETILVARIVSALDEKRVRARIEEGHQKIGGERPAAIYWQDFYERLERERQEYLEAQEEMADKRNRALAVPVPQSPDLEESSSEDDDESPYHQHVPPTDARLRFRLQRPTSAASNASSIGRQSTPELLDDESSIAGSACPTPRISLSPWIGFN